MSGNFDDACCYEPCRITSDPGSLDPPGQNRFHECRIGPGQATPWIDPCFNCCKGPGNPNKGITWTNAEVLLIGPLRTNFSDIFIKIYAFIQENTFENVVWKCETFLLSGIWGEASWRAAAHQDFPVVCIWGISERRHARRGLWCSRQSRRLLARCFVQQSEWQSVAMDKNFEKFRYSLLTLNVRGPSYLGWTRSVSWLLMPWLLTSPGHQQSWYWLCRICRSWSYMRKDFKYLCHINVELWHKM